MYSPMNICFEGTKISMVLKIGMNVVSLMVTRKKNSYQAEKIWHEKQIGHIFVK